MRKTRLAVGLTAALGASALISAPMTSPAHAAGCADPLPVTILSFTDFHGRIAPSNPDTSVFFAQIEANRDANTLVVANGDSIGATLFNSFIFDDQPTIDILNALELDAHSIGNHELDRGYADFTGRVMSAANYPYVSADLVRTAEGSSLADAPYTIATTANGVTVAFVGATTDQLPSLISPEVFDQVTANPAVDSINRYAAQLKDGDPANGEADVVVAAFHEGSYGNTSISGDVDLIINGHSHEQLATIDASGRPVIQSGSYASDFGKTTLLVDTDDAKVCSVATNTNVSGALPAGTDRDALIAASPRSVAIDQIVQQTVAAAQVEGSVTVANTTAPISRGMTADGASDNRAVESTMSNLVAQMFRDVLAGGDPDFIGVQNPGGTRADFASAGDITYAEAAGVLPFANTLMTTQLTGAQIRTMLEQQWQPEGKSRPYLALGLSDNVSYTYDESLPTGARILDVWVSGQPLDSAKLYTIGSGSFLITGGDNFTVIAEGLNPTDTGRADLEAWVGWLGEQGTVSPDYSRRGVQIDQASIDQPIPAGSAVEWVIGVPVEGSLTGQSLDLSSLAVPANTQLQAHLGSANGPVVGSATVTNGQATISINLPASVAAGEVLVHLVADPSGTQIVVPVTVTDPLPSPSPTPTPTVDPTPTPGPAKPKPTQLPKTGVAR